MRQKTKEDARGRWRSILPALGLPTALLDGKHHPCPRCGGKDRFRFTDYQGSGGFICNQCGNGSGFDLLMMLHGWDFRTAAEEVDRIAGVCVRDATGVQRSDLKKRSARNRLWQAAKPLTAADPAGCYLWKRCRVTTYSSSLRFTPALSCSGTQTSLPAMLAEVTAPDGNPSNIHRTYLTETGDKASIDAPRRMMPGPIAKGAAVRLTDAAPVLGIAEGIETAFSASALTGIPCWAALNAEMLKGWCPPDMVTRVVIFADNDENFTGQEAAYSLARRIQSDRRHVMIRAPHEMGCDWNDVHRANIQIAHGEDDS